MKNIFLMLIVLSAMQLQAQNNSFTNQITDNKGRQVLWGEINQEDLERGSYARWFNQQYTAYLPDSTLVYELKNQLNQYSITIFMGTWCGDSKREVPRFLKILQTIDFNPEQLTIVAVRGDKPYYKQGLNNETHGNFIHRVPTLIVKKGTQEIGRIVERPKASLEQDLLKLLNGDYEPNYPLVQATAKLLDEQGEKAFTVARLKDLVPVWKSKASGYHELNTYARILMAEQRTAQAIAVLKFNCSLFPEKHQPLANLARVLEDAGDQKQALKYYTKAQQLAPDNSDYASALNRLKAQK